MSNDSVGQARYYDFAKRLIDLFAAVVGLAMTAPLQAVIALLIARSMGQPILFRQERPGRGGKPFVLYKFRTMSSPRESGETVTDAQRVTPMGARLRSTSLDELPTLWNVLRGDMSLVGPRPLMMQYLERYTPREARRLEVRPGVTGLAQVSGRNRLTWSEKFDADVRYVDSRGFRLDVKILLRTFITVFRREGIGHSPEEIMPEYFGTAVQVD